MNRILLSLYIAVIHCNQEWCLYVLGWASEGNPEAPLALAICQTSH